MKKSIPIILFIVLAAGLLAGGVWYSGKLSEESQNAEVAQGAAAVQAQIAAQQALTQIMQNFKANGIVDVVVGTGAEAKSGDSVSMLYTGSLDDGTVFDASSKHGNQPFTFVIDDTGPGGVIEGWNLGVAGMKVGGKRTLVIPPELGYGAVANGSIPANSTLHFTVELLSVTAPTSTGQGVQ